MKYEDIFIIIIIIIIVVDYGRRRMPLCPHLLQLVIITYTYYLLRITLRIGLQFKSIGSPVIVHKIITFQYLSSLFLN